MTSRPQDIYPQMGEIARAIAVLADDLALIRATSETWDPAELRVDSGSSWSTDESLAAALGDLAGAEEALRAARGRIEGAWAAMGRLASD
ncbi:hypothetical protein K3888_14325 [Dietzia aurantiaca]|uniref:hypothetical protein n=1 Tax=Dietzia aurantiaca TaxID=983873 RepID=UPI001E649D00|nr:hypothetical protein [Dietzia aurantiaca]MCD2263875.1 hypothetical protein [Dietzia aurantiaca]